MPATTTTPRRASALPPAERRAAIIGAVLPLVVEHGERLTTRQIAEAAGIAEGTIFRVFTDKDELLAAVLDAALDQRPLERALGQIDPALPFEDRLVAATDLIRQRIANVWAVVSNLNPSFHRRARPLSESPALTAILESERRRLRLTPQAAARMLHALTLSLTHPMLAGSPVTSAEIVSTLLHGIEHQR